VDCPPVSHILPSGADQGDPFFVVSSAALRRSGSFSNDSNPLIASWCSSLDFPRCLSCVQELFHDTFPVIYTLLFLDPPNLWTSESFPTLFLSAFPPTWIVRPVCCLTLFRSGPKLFARSFKPFLFFGLPLSPCLFPYQIFRSDPTPPPFPNLPPGRGLKYCPLFLMLLFGKHAHPRLSRLSLARKPFLPFPIKGRPISMA